MSGYRHHHIHRSDGIKATLALLLVVLALTGVAWGLDRWQESKALTAAAEVPSEVPSIEQAPTITYQGITYAPRKQLETYLLMGIDVDGPAKGNKSYSGGGQADMQLVLVLDNENQTWQVLQINRDSMVEVQVLGLMGDVIQTKTAQIATAHAYGDGTERSCRNAVTAVSTMLGGQPIDGYMAVNMDAVAILNDMVGGVTVTITTDFTAVDPSLVEGQTITLQGEQALTFVRSRKDVDDQTNLSRMNRQQQYLMALEEQLSQKDDEFTIRAYDAIADYMVTNIGSGTAVDIGEKMRSYEELPLLTIEGKSRTDETGSNAYDLNPDSLQKTILTLFYQAT